MDKGMYSLIVLPLLGAGILALYAFVWWFASRMPGGGKVAKILVFPVATLILLWDVALGAIVLPFVYYSYPKEEVYSTVEARSVVIDYDISPYTGEGVQIDDYCLDKIVYLKKGKFFYGSTFDSSTDSRKKINLRKDDVYNQDECDCLVRVEEEFKIGNIFFMKETIERLPDHFKLAEKKWIKKYRNPAFIGELQPGGRSYVVLRGELYSKRLEDIVINPDCALKENWPLKSGCGFSFVAENI